MNPIDHETAFAFSFMLMQKKAHTIAVEHGWWERPPELGTSIALVHSELSELLEAARERNPQSIKIPNFSCEEEEAADVIIRLMDLAQQRRWRLAEAVIAKMQYNKTRPHKHGGKEF